VALFGKRRAARSHLGIDEWTAGDEDFAVVEAALTSYIAAEKAGLPAPILFSSPGHLQSRSIIRTRSSIPVQAHLKIGGLRLTVPDSDEDLAQWHFEDLEEVEVSDDDRTVIVTLDHGHGAHRSVVRANKLFGYSMRTAITAWQESPEVALAGVRLDRARWELNKPEL
jgi:hypothetical protein